MSLIDRLLGRDLTRNWVKQLSHPRVFGLDHLTISGVKPGDRFDSLDWLGPADEFHRDTHQYRWYSIGLAVVPDCNQISQIYLVWRGFTGFGVWADEVGLDYEPFGSCWACLHDGKRITLDQTVGRQALDRLLGVTGDIGGEGPKSDVNDYVSGAEYDGIDLCYGFDDEARNHCTTLHASFDEHDHLCLIRMA